MLKNIRPITLKTKNLKTQGLIFNPIEDNSAKCCVFTHGYTSHKGSILTWAQKVIDLGAPSLIFDLPGHYLGNFDEVNEFNHFIEEVPQLFEKAFSIILENNKYATKPIIGGHSLGALMALKASNEFEMFKEIICVGLGSLPINKPHLFETPFFKDTMHLRSELVSECLNPKLMLPWISEQKRQPITHNKSIHLIGGKDDIIIGGEEGINQMGKTLQETNVVDIQLITKLPHHTPENAGIFIKKTLQQIN